MAEESLNFQFNVAEAEKGLLWAFIQILRRKATGVLRAEGSAAGKSDFRKDFAFSEGKPVAIVSNRPQERLVYFLITQSKLSKDQVEELNREKVSINVTNSTVAALLKKGWIANAEIPELLESFFSERLFNLLSYRRMSLKFVEMDQLPEKALGGGDFPIQADFALSLWSALKKLLDEAYCRSRFSKKAGSGVETTGDCVLPLKPSELRLWNELKKPTELNENLSLEQLQLLVVALELGQLTWHAAKANQNEDSFQKVFESHKKMSFYEILQVDESVGSSDLKKSYFSFVKKYHPDRLPKESSPETRKLCEDILAQVNEAYDVLSDKERKTEYDAERQLAAMGGRAAVERRLRAEIKFDEAKMALRRKHFAQAMDQLNEIKKDIGDHPEFEMDYCYAQFMLGVEAETIDQLPLKTIEQQLFKAFKALKEDPYPAYYLGVFYRHTGEVEKALSAYDRAVAIDPNFSEASNEARILRMRSEKEKPKTKSWFRKT